MGTITNQNSDSLLIRSRTYKKVIKVDVNGTFKDTLKVKTGNYRLSDGKEEASLYLKNGYDLNLTLNINEFDETIKYAGSGSEPNNYLAKSALLQEKIFNVSVLLELEKNAFEQKVATSTSELVNLFSNTTKLDSTFIAGQSKNIYCLYPFQIKIRCKVRCGSVYGSRG